MNPALEKALSDSQTERPICAWLKRNPLVLCHALGRAAFPSMLVAEFPFGSDFRADFVGLGPFSGGWCISFIELEPPGAALFTSAGTAARRLNGAVAQVDSWRSFIESNRDSVVRELSKYAKTRELVWKRRGREPLDHVGWPLYHPKSSLGFYYFVVIGRRGDLTDEAIQKKAEYRKFHGIDVLTYDRIVDAADELERAQPVVRANEHGCHDPC